MRRPPPAAPRPRGKLRVPLYALLTLGVSAGLMATAWTPRAAAQDDPGGMRLTLGVNQRFEADTNQRLQLTSPGTALTSTTRLDLGFSSETRTQSLRLGAALPLRLLSLPGDSRRFVRGGPDLTFAYSRVAPRSDLTVSGSYLSEDLRFVRRIDQIIGILDPIDPIPPVDPITDPDAPPPTEDDLIDDPDVPAPPPLDELPEDEELDDLDLIDGRGTRQRLVLDSRLRLGLGGPITTTFRLGMLATRYSDDANPALTDFRRLTFGANTSLRLTPVTQGTIDLTLERFERDNLAELRRDTRRLGFGIRHEFTQTLTVDARLGYAWIETREFDVPRTSRGADASLGANLELARGSLGARIATRTSDGSRRNTAGLTYNLPMPNGALNFSASARQTDDGVRTSFTVGRNMDLRRGPLTASLGLSRSPAGNWGTIGRVTYSEQLPRGSWRVSLVQGFTLDAEDQETRRTLATAGWTHNINRSSRVNVNAAYARSPTVDNARVSATYSRDVTPDWNMNLGYRYDNRSTAAGRADSHALFLTFGRGFEIAF